MNNNIFISKIEDENQRTLDQLQAIQASVLGNDDVIKSLLRDVGIDPSTVDLSKIDRNYLLSLKNSGLTTLGAGDLSRLGIVSATDTNTADTDTASATATDTRSLSLWEDSFVGDKRGPIQKYYESMASADEPSDDDTRGVLEDMMKEVDKEEDKGSGCPTTDAALDNLVSGIAIPGLELALVITGLVVSRKEIMATVRPLVKRIKDKAAPAEVVDDAKATLKDICQGLFDSLKDTVKQAIANIKIGFQSMMNQLKEIPSVIAKAVANVAVPACIGAVSANPVKELLNLSNLKASLRGLVEAAKVAGVMVLTYCQQIVFDIPQAVKAVFDMIATADTALSTIPA